MWFWLKRHWLRFSPGPLEARNDRAVVKRLEKTNRWIVATCIIQIRENKDYKVYI